MQNVPNINHLIKIVANVGRVSLRGSRRAWPKIFQSSTTSYIISTNEMSVALILNYWRWYYRLNRNLETFSVNIQKRSNSLQISVIFLKFVNSSLADFHSAKWTGIFLLRLHRIRSLRASLPVYRSWRPPRPLNLSLWLYASSSDRDMLNLIRLVGNI